MWRPIDQQGLAPFPHNLLDDDFSRMFVTLGGDLFPLDLCLDLLPIKRRISQKDSDTPAFRQMLIDLPYDGKEPLETGASQTMMLTVSRHARRSSRDGTSATVDITVHHVLIACSAEFHNDVIDLQREIRGPNQRYDEIMYILISMEFPQCDQIISVKGRQDAQHGVVRFRMLIAPLSRIEAQWG